MIVIAAASRLLPHPPNFVPTGAMALFGAAALPKKWLVYLVPLAAYYLSDLLLNNILYAAYFDGLYLGADPYIYLGVLLMIAVGVGLLRGQAFSWLRIGGGRLWGHAGLLRGQQLWGLGRWGHVPHHARRLDSRLCGRAPISPK